MFDKDAKQKHECTTHHITVRHKLINHQCSSPCTGPPKHLPTQQCASTCAPVATGWLQEHPRALVSALRYLEVMQNCLFL